MWITCHTPHFFFWKGGAGCKPPAFLKIYSERKQPSECCPWLHWKHRDDPGLKRAEVSLEALEAVQGVPAAQCSVPQ